MAEVSLREERLSDGTIVKNVPAHVTREQVERMARGEPSEAMFQTPSGQETVQRFRGSPFASAFDRILAERPDILGAPGGELIRGAADIPMGLLELGANMLSPGTGTAVSGKLKNIESKSRAAGGRAEGDINWWRGAGAFLNPIPLKVPMARKGAGALERTVMAAPAGGGFALASPTDSGSPDESFAEKKTEQVGTGLLLGPLIQGVGEAGAKVAKGAYHGFIEPAFQRGRKMIMGRELNEAAGNLRQPVMQALEQRHEMVPGSLPTAGEAAAPVGSAEFSALQSRVSEKAPSEYGRRETTQNMARRAAVRSVGQDDASLAAAEKARGTAADAEFGALKGRQLPAGEVEPLLRGPLAQKAVKIARQIAEEQNVPFPAEGSGKPFSVDNLDLVKTALEKMIDNPAGHGISDAASRAVLETKNKLVGYVEKRVPEWKTARENFASRSKPINQMQVGQYLEDKLGSALSDFGVDTKQRAELFAKALKEAPLTIKKSLDEPRFTSLDEVLEPGQLQAVENVAHDLARKAGFDLLAKRGAASSEGGMAGKELAKEFGGRTLPNPLSRTMTIVNALLRRVQGKMDSKLERELGLHMLSPQSTKELMEFAHTPQGKQVMEALLRSGRSGTMQNVLQQSGE